MMQVFRPYQRLAPGVNHVLRCVDQDRRLYAQLYGCFIELSQAEKLARRALPYASYLLEDIFQAYYQPHLDANTDLSPTLYRHAKMINQLLSSPSYTQMRRHTVGDAHSAAIVAAITLSEIAEHLMAHKGKRRLHQQPTDDKDAASGGGHLPTWLARFSGNHSLAEQDSHAADSDRNNDELLSHYAVLHASNEARTALDNINTTRSIWGVFPGKLKDYPINEVWALINDIRRLPEFEAMTQLIADLSRLIVKKRGMKPQKAPLPHRITGVQTGRTLDNLVPFELVKLSDPELENLFHDGFENQALLHYSYAGERPDTAPPLICCLDTSASMHQAAARGLSRLCWARAVALALHAVAAEMQRPFFAICFAASGQMKVFSAPNGQLSAQDVLDLAKCHFGGGTHLETPLREALTFAANSPARTGDAIIVTDGEAPLDAHFAAHYSSEQRRVGLHLYTILIDGNHQQLRELSRDAFQIASGDEKSWCAALAQINRELIPT